jgi:hypothetical protein
LEHSPASNGALRALLGVVELLKTVFTPQVVAVLVAVGISSGTAYMAWGDGARARDV